jgi:hypothetical protein
MNDTIADVIKKAIFRNSIGSLIITVIKWYLIIIGTMIALLLIFGTIIANHATDADTEFYHQQCLKYNTACNVWHLKAHDGL